MEENEIWMNQIIKQVNKMSIIPHYTINKIPIDKNVIYLIYEENEITMEIIERIGVKEFEIIKYDNQGVNYIVEIKDEKMFNEFKRKMVKKQEREEDNKDIYNIIEMINKKEIINKMIIHISSSINKERKEYNQKEIIQEFIYSTNDYCIVNLKRNNENIINDLMKIRMNDMFSKYLPTKPFSCIVFKKSSLYQIIPFSNKLNGYIITIPQNYFYNQNCWEFYERPPFYLTTPATILLSSNYLIGNNLFISKCECPIININHFFAFKERRLSYNSDILWAINTIEKQLIAKHIASKFSPLSFSILSQRLFIQTDMKLPRTLKISDLLTLSSSRIAILEPWIDNLSSCVNTIDFVALQHWSYFYTSKRLLFTSLLSSHSFSLNPDSPSFATNVHLAHESLSKFFFANDGSYPELQSHLVSHHCNSLCSSFPL
ncbi:p53 family protein [Entamoeba histolytica HM-3:IMSS]|uniref:p53 family protein n=1 Tax=Entamoeba histolytica HM-3:IMSS TaxID=885315 RepID=M7X608_ENTHI|nr:p53 family protein [Entamoeba histolytica HM-3:IMSS]